MTDVVLTFNPAKHIYRSGDKVVPSVTQALKRSGLSTQYADVPPVYLINAAKIGSEVHAEIARLLAQSNSGAQFWKAVSVAYPHAHPRVQTAVRSWGQWMAWTNPRVISYERQAYSPKWGFAGTWDFVGELNDEVWLIDWKVTSEIDEPSWGLQTGAYSVLHDETEDVKIDRRAALHIRNADPNLVPLDDETDVGRFLTALETLKDINWEEELYAYEF